MEEKWRGRRRRRWPLPLTPYLFRLCQQNTLVIPLHNYFLQRLVFHSILGTSRFSFVTTNLLLLFLSLLMFTCPQLHVCFVTRLSRVGNHNKPCILPTHPTLFATSKRELQGIQRILKPRRVPEAWSLNIRFLVFPFHYHPILFWQEVVQEHTLFP